MPVPVHVRVSRLAYVSHALLAKCRHQLLFGDQFLAHVPALELAVVNQQKRRRTEEVTERGEIEFEPVEGVGPEDDGRNQHDAPVTDRYSSAIPFCAASAI